jgi:hypothetical protein
MKYIRAGKFLIGLYLNRSKSAHFDFIHHQNVSAKYYKSTSKSKRLVVLFHGGVIKGYLDPRMDVVVSGFLQAGYDCLYPNLNAFSNLRLPYQSDFDELVSFLNDFIEDKSHVYERVSFFGISTGCIYMIRVNTHPLMICPVDNIAMIGPYYDSTLCFKHLLEEPLNFYAQLLVLRLILCSENQLETNLERQKNLDLFYDAIEYAFNDTDDSALERIIDYIQQHSDKNNRLIKLIQRLGKPGFIDEEIIASFNNFEIAVNYNDYIKHITAKVIIVHDIADNMFKSQSSQRLSQELSRCGVANKLLISKSLNHVMPSYLKMIREFSHFLKILDSFFT